MTAPVPSPNIWNDPHVYELENTAVDRGRLIEAAMAARRPIEGARLLDLGCGSGFHLPRWSDLGAACVIGAEPHQPLALLARSRVGRLPESSRRRISVIAAAAQDLPLAGSSVDVMHARWAYFFGSGCEPGLAELDRVMAPGGLACVVDNDLMTRSTVGDWFASAYPAYDVEATERFWSRQGWERTRLAVTWQFERREEFEAVVRIEFPPSAADHILATHRGLVADYAVVLRTRRY